LSRILKTDELFSARRSVGSAFQATGPACETARSPNFVRSLVMTEFVVKADLRPERVELVDVACTLFVK
jgi:hypothetical protein